MISDPSAAANLTGFHIANANSAVVSFNNTISGTWSAIGMNNTVAVPIDSPGPSTYASPQTVTLSDSTSGAIICYTTDGSTPASTTPGVCSAGITYSVGFLVSSTATVKALGTRSGLPNSAVMSSTYTIGGTVSTPTDTPGTGTYTSTQTVTLSDATSGATICYTTDGSSPAASLPGTCSAGTTYTSGITVPTTTQIKALGTKTGLTNSGILSSIYTINTNVAIPTDTPGAGTYITSQAVTLSDITSGATICYTTNGTNPTATTPGTCSTGTAYSTPITLTATTTVKAIGTKVGATNSGMLGSGYGIQVAIPTDSPGAGTYGTAQSVTLSDSTGSAVICYTVDGSTPAAATPGTCSAGTTYSGAITISTTKTLKALGTKSGLVNSGVLTSVYTISGGPPSFTVGTPVSYLGNGSQTSAPAVSMTSDGTPSGTAVTPSIGKLLVVSMHAAQGASTTIASCTDNAAVPNTYTLDKNQQNGNTGALDVALLHTIVGSVQSSGFFTITCTATGASYWWGTVTPVTIVGTLTVDGTAAADTTSTTVGAGTITPTASEVMLVFSAYSDASTGSETIAAGSGYTIPTNGSSLNGLSYTVGAIEYQVVSSTSGSYSPTYTVGNGGLFRSGITVGYTVH